MPAPAPQAEKIQRPQRRSVPAPSRIRDRQHNRANLDTGRQLESSDNIYDNDRDLARAVYRQRQSEAQNKSSERFDRERRRHVEGEPDSHADSDGHEGHGHSERHAPHHVSHGHHHQHGPNCGHHHYDGRWHDFPRHHVHHRGCGHRYSNGSWISVSISLGHTHGIGCGHFYDNGIWLSHTGSLHVHGIGCGHYFHDGFWHNTPRYHRHHAGCGHYYYESSWHDFPPAHVHTSSCGHIYDGATWLVSTHDSHVHGSGCGHYHFEGRWRSYPRSYYTRNRPDSFYFFVDLGDYQRRNLPTRVYSEHLQDERVTDVFYDRDPISNAYAAFSNGRYYDALINFNRAIEEDADNGLLYLARAQTQIAIKDYRSAYDDLIRGMELIPEWADVNFNIAEIYSDKSDLQQHTAELEAWVERFPRDFKAHFVLGYFYYFHQDYASAKNELVYTLSWDEQHEQAHGLMDRILEFEAESEVVTRETEEVDPDQPSITTE